MKRVLTTFLSLTLLTAGVARAQEEAPEGADQVTTPEAVQPPSEPPENGGDQP